VYAVEFVVAEEENDRGCNGYACDVVEDACGTHIYGLNGRQRCRTEQ
jgi:hypothetical protein